MTAPPHAGPTAPVVGKVTVFHAQTGQPLVRWPVDARSLVASGCYGWSPPGEVLDAPLWAQGLGEPERADVTADPFRATAPAAPVADALPPVGPKLTPLGQPVIATHSSEASPAKPYEHPSGYTKGRDRDNRGRR